MIRPRIFVSSVIEDFSEHREAARRGIVAAGAEPVLVNEDFPPMNASPRNACLDAVEASDIYIAVIGERGGWRAPSGKLVVEEEFLHAKRKGIPVLVFLFDTDRDEDATSLARSFSDYVTGQFRKTYKDTAELERLIAQSFESVIRTLQMPTFDLGRIERAAESPHEFTNEAGLRLVVAPERADEIIHPAQMASDELVDRIYALGHDKTVKLFSYAEAKDAGLEGDSLVITQVDQDSHRRPYAGVRLALHESGMIILDANITGRRDRGDRHGLGDSMLIAKDELIEVLRTFFRFVAALYEEVDSYQRHQSFFYDAVLGNVEHRSLVDAYREQGSYSMPMRLTSTFTAFGQPRRITRGALSDPDDEIARVISKLERGLNNTNRGV